MELHVLVVKEEKSSIMIRKSVNVLKIQDGMDMDVLLKKLVKMEGYGMSLASYVSVL